MARRPDLPCAVCGVLMWSGTTSLPPGVATCLPCRRLQNGPRLASCSQCQSEFKSVRRSDGRWSECCSMSCAQKLRAVREGRCLGRDPEKLRANARAKNHRRRTKMRIGGDVTAAYERRLRSKAKRCPLCDVKLLEDPYQSASKELDHIIPINVGGTHTIGNVRIICRKCNGSRPLDGSDFIGQPTLWSTDPDVAVQPAKPKKVKPPRAAKAPRPPKPKPQPRPCRDCGVEIIPEGRGRPRTWCDECRPSEYLKRKAA